ncbi:putative phage tail protein [Robertmurraya andreesenii]|uniref:Phage portal protein n=1 Tax=Anoxybacillus andreesenii TaxID=1325932 RepID=A0ABT9V1S3_9BACL|nr:putative phage tail protein [Robertmurraya andreesenii]MDQ0154902.1 hypothetical protein [Robertmurraya andreesenii]
MKLLGTEITRNIQRDMFEYMPKEYEDYIQSRAIVEVESEEFERLNEIVADVLAQFFVDTATWGLAYWERLVGIITDENVPINERRSVVKVKLRGYNTINAVELKSIISAYEYGEIDVTEIPAQHTIEIDFKSEYGVPANLEELERLLCQIMPAHLRTKLFAKHNWHRKLRKYTHAELSLHSHIDIRTQKALRDDYKR